MDIPSKPSSTSYGKLNIPATKTSIAQEGCHAQASPQVVRTLQLNVTFKIPVDHHLQRTVNGKRHRGVPRRRFKDKVKFPLLQAGISPHSWETETADRL